MGDVEQIDRRKKEESPLEKIFDVFKDDPIVGTIEFTDEDCVRNPIIPKILSKLRDNGI
jgi:phosphate starvation-inducible protein PhoH